MGLEEPDDYYFFWEVQDNIACREWGVLSAKVGAEYFQRPRGHRKGKDTHPVFLSNSGILKTSFCSSTVTPVLWTPENLPAEHQFQEASTMSGSLGSTCHHAATVWPSASDSAFLIYTETENSDHTLPSKRLAVITHVKCLSHLKCWVH